MYLVTSLVSVGVSGFSLWWFWNSKVWLLITHMLMVNLFSLYFSCVFQICT